MAMKIIVTVLAVLGGGFLLLAALWFMGFLKVCQALAWLYEDWDRRF